METTAHRAHLLEAAAPPGGWPNLTSELVEVRFYLQQGLFDDAYELLTVLQKRYPGHPQLVDLARKPKAATRVDTDVLALVDAVLAESVNLVAKVARRQAPRWHAPSAPGPDRTQVHTTVPVGKAEAKAVKTPTKPSKTTSGKHTATKTGSQSKTGRTGGQKPVAAKTKTGGQKSAGTTGRRPITPPPPRGRTEMYKVGDAPTKLGATPPNTGHTVIVDALQPAAPFEAAEEPTAKRGANAKAGRKRPPEPAPAKDEGDERTSKRRRASFGEHVLNRLR